MTLLSSLVNVVLPAFLVMGVGSLLSYFFKPDVTALNRVALYAAVPALVFNSLSNTALSLQNVGHLSLAYLLFLILMLFLSWLFSWRFKAASRRGFMATSTYANSANLLLPVALFAFGDAGLERALVIYVITNITMFTTAPIVLTGGFKKGLSLKKLLALPVIWASLLGIIFNLLNWNVPLGLSRGIEILSQAAIPTVLLVLGIHIQRSGLALPKTVNWFGASFKLIAGPVIAFALGSILNLQGLDLAVLTLVGAMPPAINNFMLALEFGADAESVAKTVILSTVMALFTISIIITFLIPLGN